MIQFDDEELRHMNDGYIKMSPDQATRHCAILYWAAFYKDGSYYSGMQRWESCSDGSVSRDDGVGVWVGEEKGLQEHPTMYWQQFMLGQEPVGPDICIPF